MKRPLLSKALRIACSVWIGAIAPTGLFAANFTWDGDGANNSWTTDANWSGGTKPANDGTAVVVLTNSPAPATYSSYVDTAFNINQLNLIPNLSGTAFSLSGSALTFSGTGTLSASTARISITPTNNSSVINTIANDIILNNDLRLLVGAGSFTAILRLSGNISGNHAIDIGGTTGTTRLSGDNSFTGGINMGRGILELASDTAAGTGSLYTSQTNVSFTISAIGSRVLGNDLVLSYLNLNNETGATLFQGTLTLNGSVVLGAGTKTTAATRGVAVDLNSTLKLNGNISQTNGTSDLYLGGQSTSKGASASTAANSKIVLGGDGTYTGQTRIGRSDAAFYGTIFVEGDISSSSETIVYNGMVLRGSGGKVSNVTINGGAILAPGGTAANASAIGTLNVAGDVTLNGADDGTNNAILRINLTGGLAPAGDKLALSGAGANLLISDHVTLALTLTGGSLLAPVTIATWTDAVTPDSYGTFATITLNGSTTEWDNSGYTISYGANSLTVVPEPGAVALVIMAGLGLVIFRRRKIA